MDDTRPTEPDPREQGTETDVDAPEETTAPTPETAGTDEPAGDEAAAAEPEPTAEELLTAERDALHEKWLRAVAEMENVRKRARREVVDARRFAQADLLRPLLAVADDLERALGSLADDGDATVESVREGVALIQQRFRTVLKDHGVETVDALEAAFDPSRHEAVGQAEREGVDPGMVVEVVQQGYRLGDLLLRPARVIISS